MSVFSFDPFRYFADGDIKRLFLFLLLNMYMCEKWHRLKTGPGPPGPKKKRTRSKNRPQGLKSLPFASCHMKGNSKVIHFHKK